MRPRPRPMRFALHLLCVWPLALVACGAASSKPSAATPSHAIATAASSTSAAPPPRAEPLTTVDLLPADAELYLHVDLARLRKSPLSSPLRELVTTLARGTFTELQRACGVDPLDVVRDAAAAARLSHGAGRTAMSIAELDRGPEAALDCMRKLGAQPDGDGGVVPMAGLVARARGPYLFVGDEAGVREATARAERGERSVLAQSMHEAIARFPDAVLVGAARVGALLPETGFDWATVALTASDGRTALRIEADAADPITAQAYARAFDSAQWLGAASAELTKGRLWAEGSRVFCELSVEGPPAEQARRVGAASAIAIRTVQRYLERSKEAEARANVAAIGVALMRYVEHLPVAKRRFPPSAPLTPKDVPAGTALTLAPGAWNHATWRAIQFEPSGPVRYSYEIVTAPGAKSAVVRAWGDLDGDGVPSSYGLKLTLDRKGLITTMPEPTIEGQIE